MSKNKHNKAIEEDGTMIPLRKSTRKRIKILKAKTGALSYDELITKLLDRYE